MTRDAGVGSVVVIVDVVLYQVVEMMVMVVVAVVMVLVEKVMMSICVNRMLLLKRPEIKTCLMKNRSFDVRRLVLF